MPAYLKALAAILLLAVLVFAFAKGPSCTLATTPGDFERRRNLWFAITLTAFLAHNFWIYIIVTAALLFFAARREPNKLAMFFFVLFAVPAISAEIPSPGVISNLFVIHYLRLLSLVVLLPAFLMLRKQQDIDPFGRSMPDKLLAGYIILQFLLMMTVASFTNTVRYGIFYAFIDVFLPYYVASRSLKNLEGFRDALMGFVLAALVLSAIGAFEFAKRWLLYSSLDDALGVDWEYGGMYLHRGDNLRSQASTGQPIILGFVVAVAIGFYLYLRRSTRNPVVWGLGLMLLIAGLISPLARGPWVGVAVMSLVFIAISPAAALRLTQIGLVGIFALPVLLATPVGDVIVDHLPFVGTIQAENVTYRQRLLEISIGVILKNPFFGSFDYYSAPEMQALMQGQGIIDLVNTYVAVALGSGLVGLSLFSGFFIAVAVAIIKGIRSLSDRNDERHFLGRTLLATLVGILVIIVTASSTMAVPVIYWSVAGLGVAYVRMLTLASAPAKAQQTASATRFKTAAAESEGYVNYRNR